MRKNIFKVLPMLVSLCLYLVISVDIAYGQCGLPGTPTCQKKTTPKKTSTKTTTKPPEAKKKTISKKTQSISISNNSLRNKLIGMWESEEFRWTFAQDDKGNMTMDGADCQKFSFNLTKGLLKITPTWGDNSHDSLCSNKVKTYRIEFNKNGRLGVTAIEENGDYFSTEWWRKIK